MYSGYTLVELLVVIAIISILGVIGYINFRNFSSDQVTIKATGVIQTLLRLAQSNATSSTLCNGQGGAFWSLNFKDDKKSVELGCGLTIPTITSQKTYTLENAEVDSILGSDCGLTPLSLPFTVIYSSGLGDLTFSSPLASSTCLASSSWTFTLKNAIDTSKTKTFKLSSGGAIDVQ